MSYDDCKAYFKAFVKGNYVTLILMDPNGRKIKGTQVAMGPGYAERIEAARQELADLWPGHVKGYND